MADKEEKLEIKLKPFFRSKKVDFEGTTYYVRTKNIPGGRIYNTLNIYKGVLDVLEDNLNKGEKVILWSDI